MKLTTLSRSVALPAVALGAGLVLAACGSATVPPDDPATPRSATSAPTTPSAVTTTSASAPTTSAAPSTSSAAPSDGSSEAPSGSDGGSDLADAAKAATTWADDLLGGKNADACALMDDTGSKQLIGYARKSDPTVRTCPDAALALFQQADMQGTAYAKATAKPAEQDSGAVTFTLTYTEGRKAEQVIVVAGDAGWLVADYQPAS